MQSLWIETDGHRGSRGERRGHLPVI
jgi:hypothetical protein